MEWGGGTHTHVCYEIKCSNVLKPSKYFERWGGKDEGLTGDMSAENVSIIFVFPTFQ